MEVGYSRVVITPPIGTPMAGYAARRKPSMGVHSDLYARCVVLKQEDRVFGIVSLDLTGIDRRLYENVLERVKGLGFKGENLIIAGTHTHSGPDIFGGYSDLDHVLREMYVRKIVGAIEWAYENLTEARVVSGVGRVEEVVLNRRDPLHGAVDPRLHVVGFRTESGAYYVIVNFTCHATVLGPSNLLISPDYPGALVNFIERNVNAKALFLNGACGDINPRISKVSLDSPYAMKGSFKDVEWMGNVLGAEAVKTLLLSCEEREEFEYRAVKVSLGLQDFPSRSEVESELENVLRRLSSPRDEMQEMELRLRAFKARRILRFLELYGNKGVIEVELRGLKLSDRTAMIFLPGEAFVNIGLRIKHGSGFANTMVVGYANEQIGYIPLSEDYERGGYEATFPVTILQKGEGEKLVSEALKLLNEVLVGS